MSLMFQNIWLIKSLRRHIQSNMFFCFVLFHEYDIIKLKEVFFMARFCSNCGSEVGLDDNVCGNCGNVINNNASIPVNNFQSVNNTQSFNNSQPIQNNQTDGFAVTGFILSLVSILCCGGTSFLGLIFSIVGLVNCNKTGKGGKELAIAGIVLSAILLILIVLFYALGIISSFATELY